MGYKLVCFDADGTLIDNIVFSWQLFHDYLKTDKLARDKAKHDFIGGKSNYEDWARHDIKMWMDVKAKKSDFISALQNNQVRMMPGAVETVNELRKRGYKLAIISGTINIVIEYLWPNYETFFDYVYLSRIFFDDSGYLCGIDPTKYDMHMKAEALKLIAVKEGITLKECAFIGDHLNDLEIAKTAGFSIAFNVKDKKLEEVSSVTIRKKNLKEILKFF